MNRKRDSNRNSFVLAIGIICVSFVLLLGSYLRTKDSSLLIFQSICLLMIWGCVYLFFQYMRKRVVMFSDILCKTLDDMVKEEMNVESIGMEETLLDKIMQRLVRLYEITLENRKRVNQERVNLQELISDISHQVKTPIANLKLMNATMMEQALTKEKQLDFLQASEQQLDKLDFLMQAMIKTSRLESGVITLEKKKQNVYETLAIALGGIFYAAEKKKIDISVDCLDDMILSHDRKWTAEALFNILDNAVKYTPSYGKVRVVVAKWDMYVKIDIANTGKGIPERNQGKIFQRFYRGDDKHDIEGIGIGLYLAREIITKQGGYITVKSELDKETMFSIFLPIA